ncbi:MAG TPA: glycosyltransferase [Candidatus Dormibacteraeota bacterium]|nr:glycosyltransferase [Candidatus Dormibacteraeota bacterium]
MGSTADASPRIAVLIPCHNEEPTVGQVVAAFRAELPAARIYVFDNNSTDRTVECARAAGAIVLREPRQGKGFVVQSMFRRVDADVYIMVDGDGTYPAAEVHRLVAPIIADEADMVVGSRLHPATHSEFRPLNRWANLLVLALLNSIFRVQLTDILSGYRAFNRHFVKGLPLFGGGFEIETELTIKAVARGMRIVEIPTTLTTRPEGSQSKIKFLGDGFLILNTILALFRDYKPLTFFGGAGSLLVALSLVPAVMVIIQALTTGFVTHVSWAVLAAALGLMGMLLILAGLILHTIVRRFQEIEHILQDRGDEVSSNSVTRGRQDAP